MAIIDIIAKASPANRVVKPTKEIGVTGLQRTRESGYIFEEWLRDLSVNRWKIIYREMRDNDPVIGGIFFVIETFLRRVDWHMEAADGSGKQGEEYAEFIWECLDDMSHPFSDYVSESSSMFTFGHALAEVVYKKREGLKGKKSSKFSDGLIGWRKFSPRAQESIINWEWDEDGGLQGVQQLAAPDYGMIRIPIERLILQRTTSLKNNPEGRSILRNCYVPWFRKRRLEEVEGIGIERDLCGIPVLYATPEAIEGMGGMDIATALVRNLRMDDQMGVVLPFSVDSDGNPAVRLELMKSAGGKQTDVDATLRRYDNALYNTCIAGFIQFGQQSVGARSMHTSSSGFFLESLKAHCESFADKFNRFATTRLMALNDMDIARAPKLVPGDIGIRDLEEVGAYIESLTKAGFNLNDLPTEEYLRKQGRLPKVPEDRPEPIIDPVTGLPMLPQQPGQQSGKPANAKRPDDPSAAEDEEDLDDAV